jgi:hypothetical protein
VPQHLNDSQSRHVHQQREQGPQQKGWNDDFTPDGRDLGLQIRAFLRKDCFVSANVILWHFFTIVLTMKDIPEPEFGMKQMEFRTLS